VHFALIQGRFLGLNISLKQNKKKQTIGYIATNPTRRCVFCHLFDYVDYLTRFVSLACPSHSHPVEMFYCNEV
jgi:hypothetical protein